MGSLSESESALWFTKLRSTALLTSAADSSETSPASTTLPDMVCAAFLAIVDFDTFAGELFRFHDEFYAELLPRQSTYTVNTLMQSTHSRMRCQLLVFMILYYEAE
ncbi:hypothetical protein XU18_0926 [Perkinsela sp. CCAP 1560/4]|nr:hypothetical protein XU18_0926 [Perkinsela sp. CCAP 1560/4]|eukprot:KNH08565.1 hypothetical protein XU18_0926 [Perkinsela sp. CCAP 1560/4]